MLIKNFIKQFIIRSYNLIRLDLLNDINKLKQNDRNSFIQLEIKNLLLQKQLKFNLKNKKIQIYILIYHRAHWGAMDSVYNELKLNGFDVTIVITPALNIQKELRYNEMEQNYKFFNSLGYKVVKGYDFKTNSLFNIEESLPDIIIYQTHWMADYPYEYNIMHYYNKALCISIPYSYMLAAIQNEQFNQEFHDLVWFNCATTKADKIMAEKYSIVHAENVIVTGYPKMDYLFDDNQIKSNTKWKNIQTKKIIYAPHYSINTDWEINFATFDKYYLNLFNYLKIKKNIEILLKPHPMLKSRCIELDIMSDEQYEKFINDWNTLSNGLYDDSGNYLDIFKTSDAMILDSISFIVEYAHTKKPICFINKYESLEELLLHFNEFGKIAVQNCYIAQSFEDVKMFIENVVINGNDPMYEDRINFFNQYLNINCGNAGKFIVKKIKDSIIF